MVDEGTYNELDRYYTGRMQVDERNAFESRLSSDSNLKSELDWIINATAAMKNSGRTVMKQHIANMLAGIPAGEIAKYTPAKNGISFWKKWWWAVSIVVVTAVAVTLLMIAHRSEGGIYYFFNPPHESDQYEPEESVTKKFLIDSCADSVAQPMEADSAKAELKPENSREKITKEEAMVHYDGQPGLTKGAKTPKVERDREFQQDNIDYVAYGWNDTVARNVTLGGVGSRDEPMGISISNRQKPPYTYQLDKGLLLNVNYFSTAGFKFNGSGDTVYMTDLDGQTFMLLRGRGELPLNPIKGVSK